MKESLFEEIRAEIKGRAGEYSLYFKDFSSSERLFLAIDRVYPAASIIKIPIMIEAFRQLEAGGLPADRLLKIPPGERVGGSGILHNLRDNLAMSIGDLVELMITLSDNTATNILIDLLGIDNINKTIRQIGLKDTVLARKMMDDQARNAGRENYTTARDMGRLLESIYYREIPGLSISSIDEIFKMLTRQLYRDNLSFYIPERYWGKIASKTGTLAGVIHDAAVFAFDQTAYVLVMLSGHLPTNVTGRGTLARVSKMIFEAKLPLGRETCDENSRY